MDPYTDDDIEYRNTRLYSPIPPPGVPLDDVNYRRRADINERRYREKQREMEAEETQGSIFTLSRPANLTMPAPERWLKRRTAPLGPKDQNRYYPMDIAQEVYQLKSALSQVDHTALCTARSRSNPYECLGRSIFINRAAVKLANIDAIFRLTAQDPNQSKDDDWYFADLCGGPGGFSEYLLWRRHTWGYNARGWGITLKIDASVSTSSDYTVERFHPDALASSCFSIVYGKHPDSNGDICDPSNIHAFSDAVKRGTNGQGVHLVVADGGFDVSGQEEKQEMLATQLIVCEILTMLHVLRKGGNFVCKFFDVTMPRTAELLYILYQCFETIHVVKPVASRPANAERYVVAMSLRDYNPSIIKHLFAVNADMEMAKRLEGKELIDVIGRDCMEADRVFMDWLRNCNRRLVSKQWYALDKLLQYIKNPELPISADQESIRRECFQKWCLPLDA